MLLKQHKTATIMVICGAMLEYYSYMLLAAMLAKQEFLLLFFGPVDDFILRGTLFFVAAALCRPFGALFFGWIGDKYGRGQALFIALVTMAISCFAIALLPGYAQIGCGAIVVLFLARVLQIISASGETNGAPIFLIEHFGFGRSCFASGLAYFGTMTGSALASLASNSGLNWRLAFLIGGLAGFVGLAIRKRIPESHAFTEAGETTLASQNIWSYLVVGIVSSACSSGFYFMYSGAVALDHTLLTYRTLSTVIYSLTLVLAGIAADYTCVFRFMKIGLLGFTLSFIGLLSTGYSAYYLALALCLGIFAGPSHSFMYRFFPPKCRYKGVSLSYSIATATIGAGTPFMVCKLANAYQTSIAALLWLIPIFTITYFILSKAKRIWESTVKH